MSTTDRANVVVTAFLQIICQALRTDPALRAELAELLCDEYEDIRHQARSEIRLKDD